MLDFWGNDNIIENINLDLKNNKIPHCQLIDDSNGNGGLLLGLKVAESLLGKNPFNHPDCNIYFPLEKDDLSENSIEKFKSLFRKINYCCLADWKDILNSNTQLKIRVKDINNLHEKILLKSYEGKNKIFILWGPELLNNFAGNKLLKILEEPPSNTYFIMISEKIGQILPTIISRSIVLKLKQFSHSEIKNKLLHMKVDSASEIAKAAGGSWTKALYLSKNSNKIKEVESMWLNALRSAFKSVGNKKIIIDLMSWADQVSSLTRDEQKNFLKFGSNLIRNALLINYNAEKISNYYSLNNFKIEKLSPFIHSKNIFEIIKLINNTFYEISRNANSRILFSNFILKISKYLNQKEI